MIGLTIISNLELSHLLVQNGAANGISRHYSQSRGTVYLLLLIIVPSGTAEDFS